MKAANFWPVNSNGEIIVQAGTGNTTIRGYLPNDQVAVDDSSGAVVMKLPATGATETKSVNALGSVTSGSVSIDCTGPSMVSFTVGAALTISLTNTPALNNTVEKTIYVTNGSAFAITYPTNSRWPGPGIVQTAPTLVASGTEILKFRATNIGGTVYVDWFYLGRVA